MSITTCRAMRNRTLAAAAVAVAVLAAVAMPAPAHAVAVTHGYRDFSYGPPDTSSWLDPDKGPTGQKPQSKLWFAQGTWWGCLRDAASGQFRIYRFLWADQSWQDTGTVVDTRDDSHADVLWDGSRLYIVSAGPAGSGTTGRARLYRYNFDTVTGDWVIATGFPVNVSPVGVEAVVLANDSTGRLWVTYTQDNQVRVTYSLASDTNWASPFVPPVSGTSVTADDISAIIANRGRIVLVWSNQGTDAIYVATHVDGADPGSWEASRRPLEGPKTADDHLSVRALEADAAGRVFVAVKTSLDNATPVDQNAPQIYLLVLGTDDVWRKYVHSRVRDKTTRPIVLIDEEHRELYMFVTAPTPGGSIYVKHTPLDSISLGTGPGDPFISSASDPEINNATSTKQNLSSATGLLVLASDQSTGYYLHNTLDLGSGPPPPPPPPAGAYQDVVLADHPAGYWRLGDSGTTAAALAGPPGTVTGGVTTGVPGAIAGDPDTAMGFDGTSGYVAVPSTAAVSPSDVTVEAWARPRGVGGAIVQKGGSSGYSVWEYRLGITSGNQWRGTVFVGSSAYSVTAPSPPSTAAWTHLALTRSGTVLTLYVNGSAVASTTVSGATNVSNGILAVGRAGSSASGYFPGDVDEVAVYPVALTAAQVGAHYAAGTS